MAKITLDVPAELAVLLKEMEAKLKAEASKAKRFEEVDPDGALAAIDKAGDAMDREMKRRLLQSYDADAPHVRIGGQRYARVGRYETTYKTLQGPVSVTRSLYRECGKRNAPTIDTVSARVGAIADGWLPETAAAMGHLLATGTSREAEATASALRTLPYCRSSFERVAHVVGDLYSSRRENIEAALAEQTEIPADAASVSVSLDRVAVPMEEPRPRSVGRPKKGAPKRPISVAWRMAYAGCVTFHDRKGEALKTLRYGRMPQSGATGLARRLAEDVQASLLKRPQLAVAVLTDGAPEMHALLDEAVRAHAPAASELARLVDFWHLMEKLGHAARVLVGDARAEALCDKWKLALLNTAGAAWRIASELHESGRRDVIVNDRKPVHDAITYLENNGERMHYSEARQRGLPIGSGNVEATCKALVSLRMKRPGARWKEDTGQHIIDLRSLAISDRWNPAMTLTLAPLRNKVRRAA